ncbi:MAG: GNAT family N-acetyltransferase [Desulfarculaceae bacterium]|nr:GNAT family N-acetyltransferase [Desulfarculaceae bacterium]
MPRIVTAGPERHPELLALWEASVRTTHHFLGEEDIVRLKPLILESYFNAVELCCLVDEQDRALGFLGTAQGKIEMLFIAPEQLGRGLGRLLAAHATEELGAVRVDVNEQNPQALGFYEHLGFRVVGRSPLDGEGRPFPLLHLELRRV